jgi:uncharacterized protein YfbU (UPF0304 family)
MTEKKIIKENLTLDELRTFEGFENVSDEEGVAILDTIITFSDIVVSIYSKQKNNTEQDSDNYSLAA